MINGASDFVYYPNEFKTMAPPPPAQTMHVEREYVYREGMPTFSVDSFQERSVASLFKSRYHAHLDELTLPDTAPRSGRASGAPSMAPELSYISKMRALQLAGDKQSLIREIQSLDAQGGSKAKGMKKLVQGIYSERLTDIFDCINNGTRHEALKAIERLKRHSPYCHRVDRDFYSYTQPSEEESLDHFGVRAAHYKEIFNCELITRAQDIYEARFAKDFELEQMTSDIIKDLETCADNDLKRDMSRRFLKRLITKFCDPKQIALDIADNYYSDAVEKYEMIMMICSDDPKVKIDWIKKKIMDKYHTLEEFYYMSVEERTDFLADCAYDKIIGKGSDVLKDSFMKIPKALATKRRLTMDGVAQKGMRSDWHRYSKKFLTIEDSGLGSMLKDFIHLCPENIERSIHKGIPAFKGKISGDITVHMREFCKKTGAPVLEFRNGNDKLLYKIRYMGGKSE